MIVRPQTWSQELLDCALPAWYPSLQDLTVPSMFIKLSQSFVDYLCSDGIILPQGCEFPSPEVGSEDDDWSDHSDAVQSPPAFPDIIAGIASAIVALGSKGVFPKLNWSAPKDAIWITATNSLCCTNPAEVVLLLKSSGFLAHDIACVSEYNATSPPIKVQHTLCLRKWVDIPPSCEYRCFVKAGDLIGISQRDVSTHYSFLSSLREQLVQEIQDYHLQQLSNRVTLQNYVFDVFREKEGKYVLVDFNPFSAKTDPLLYTWDELEAWQGEGPDVRLVDVGCIQPAVSQSYKLPQDVVDLCTGEDFAKFMDLFDPCSSVLRPHTADN